MTPIFFPSEPVKESIRFYSSDTIYYADRDMDFKTIKKFGLPLNDKTICPVCGTEGTMAQIIAHLNNTEGNTFNVFDREHGTHGWTFKQIGLWLKELGY